MLEKLPEILSPGSVEYNRWGIGRIENILRPLFATLRKGALL
jgi:hypothetical protein